MSWESFLRRRFEVVTAALALSLGFLVVVWGLMVLLKALNPYAFHFNLLMDFLPWLTPVVILLILVVPLYWRIAGWLQDPEGGLQRLAAKRFELVMGSAAYLLVYTMLVWGVMVILRAWDGYDFHFNLEVDWLPAILPPWAVWAIGSIFYWKTIGALGGLYEARPHRMSWTPVVVPLVVGASLLTGGGLILNQGVYAGTEGSPPAVQQDLVAFGTLVFTVGAVCWAVMLLGLWRGWRPLPPPPGHLTPLDRLRMERGRIAAQGFVVVNLAFGVAGLMMTAFQYVDAQDFHFYMAKDIWSVGLPLFFGWLLFATGLRLVPALLVARDPARWGTGEGSPAGPTGLPSPQGSWGYRDLAGTGS
ncbi:MAG: hypothetical protein M0T72_09555 [Candidatus Dormibacteraeota bacterium]|nr:hypothetical protein [Candidatus Dormibacteraeota bacterium]